MVAQDLAESDNIHQAASQSQIDEVPADKEGDVLMQSQIDTSALKVNPKKIYMDKVAQESS